MKKRRKLVFDLECTRAYSFLLSYPTLDDARANVPQLARAIGIPAKAVGGYLTQASTNPRVTKHLLSLGYSKAQIPSWFKSPKEPPTPQNETPSHKTQPTSGVPSQIPLNELVKLHPPPNINSEQKQMDYLEKWWKKSPSTINELDMSMLPPGSYIKRILWDGDETQPKPRQAEKAERVEEKPVKPDEPEFDWAGFVTNYAIMDQLRNWGKDIAKTEEEEETKQIFRDSTKPLTYVKPDTPKQTATPIQETHKSTPLKLVNVQELAREREQANIDYIKGIGRIYVDYQEKKNAPIREKIANFRRELDAQYEAFNNELNESRRRSRRRRHRSN